MAKTVTLQNTRIQSIIINKLNDKAGYVCNVTYAVCDDNGNPAMHSSSQKFTLETENNSNLMTADASELVTNFANAIQQKMDAREEL